MLAPIDEDTRSKGKLRDMERNPSTEKKLSAQLKYAEKKGIPLAIFYGESERARKLYNLRDLRTRQSHDGLNFEALVRTVSRLLKP